MKIDKHNYEEWMVEHLEGNLSPEQEVLFEQFMVEHPELQSELEMFDNTFLSPDTTVTYPDKNALKKRDSKIIGLNTYFRYASAIAAALLLFAAVRFIMPKDAVTGTNYTSEIEKPEIHRTATTGNRDTAEYTAPVEVDLHYAENTRNPQPKNIKIEDNRHNLPNTRIAPEEFVTAGIQFAQTGRIESSSQLPRIKTTDFSEQYAALYNYYFDKMMEKTQSPAPASIVDRINNTLALANDFGNLVTRSKTQNTGDSVSEPHVKTTSIKFFDIEFYNRRTVNQ